MQCETTKDATETPQPDAQRSSQSSLRQAPSRAAGGARGRTRPRAHNVDQTPSTSIRNTQCASGASSEYNSPQALVPLQSDGPNGARCPFPKKLSANGTSGADVHKTARSLSSSLAVVSSVDGPLADHPARCSLIHPDGLDAASHHLAAMSALPMPASALSLVSVAVEPDPAPPATLLGGEAPE